MPAKTLRAVTPGEKPSRKKPLTLTQAVEGGDYLEILRAQRREMVRDVADERGPAKAAMHRQIALLSKEIATLESPDGDDEVRSASKTPDEAWDSSAI